MSGEKTEQPTDKKLRDARDKGQVAKSQDVNAAVTLLVFTLVLGAALPLMADPLVELFDLIAGPALAVQDDAAMLALAYAIAFKALKLVLPFVVAGLLAGLVGSFGQVGLKISFEPVTPKFDKINPAAGLKRLVSVRSLIDLAKMLAKTLALGSVVVMLGLGLLPLLVGATLQTPRGLVDIGWAAVGRILAGATLIFSVIGMIDFGLQRWLFRRDQRMSKDEVKREHKDAEGDPYQKAMRKGLARENASAPPSASRVAGASAVVTNPTHYAVAIFYQPGAVPLPVVVARGVDEDAARIREQAEAHGVPIMSHPPLARALYQVPLGQPVPEALFEAVAAVLRWVAVVQQLSDEQRSRHKPA